MVPAGALANCQRRLVCPGQRGRGPVTEEGPPPNTLPRLAKQDSIWCGIFTPHEPPQATVLRFGSNERPVYALVPANSGADAKGLMRGGCPGTHLPGHATHTNPLLFFVKKKTKRVFVFVWFAMLTKTATLRHDVD